MLHRLDSDPGFLNRVCFSDESTFHFSGLIYSHNSRIWGLQNPHETYELERDSPKLNVWCGIMHDKIIGPFFFAEKSIAAQIYLDLLTEYVSPQLEQYQPLVIFQQLSAPPHWVLQFVNFGMTHFQKDRLEVMVPFHGRHVSLISHHWIFSCGAM